MIKLIVSDLDNTLYDENKNIPKSTIEMIQKAMKEKNIDFCVATGRSFYSAKNVADTVGSNSPIICYNGAMIREPNGNIISATYVDELVVKELIEFCKKNNLYIQIYNNDEIIVEKKRPDIHDDPDMNYAKCIEVGEFDINKIGRTPKVLIADDEKNIPKLMEFLSKKFHNRAYVTQSESHLIEIMAQNANKGVALKEVISLLGLTIDQVMACGDNINDDLLLKNAAVKIAVSNAVSSLKDIATYTCKNERSYGVEEAIKKFVFKA